MSSLFYWHIWWIQIPGPSPVHNVGFSYLNIFVIKLIMTHCLLFVHHRQFMLKHTSFTNDIWKKIMIWNVKYAQRFWWQHLKYFKACELLCNMNTLFVVECHCHALVSGRKRKCSLIIRHLVDFFIHLMQRC